MCVAFYSRESIYERIDIENADEPESVINMPYDVDMKEVE